MLVKSYTLESYSMPCRVPIGSSCFCSNRFPKYWAWVYFHSEPHSYVIQLDSLTLEVVKIKRYLETIYWVLFYDEGFGSTKVKSSLQRKQSIDTHAIMGAVSSMERKEIFDECEVMPFFNMSV